MASKIVLITSHYLYQPTVDALNRIGVSPETEIIPYDNFTHIATVYDQYAEEADAFMVSGPSAKRAIEQSRSGKLKPITSFSVGPDAMYRDILRLVVDSPDQDLHRVAMDFLLPLDCGYSVADFLAFDDIDQVDGLILNWMSQTGTHDVGGAENIIMERILALWRKKEIDLVICQYSSIAPMLDTLGIPYRCPFPSDSHLKSMLQDIQARVELKHLHENLPAIIQIIPEGARKLAPEQLSALRQHVRQFTQDNLIECVEQDAGGSLVLITTMQVLQFLTNSFRSCRLSAYLETMLDFPVSIGYGVGATVPHAMSNVQVAVHEAKISGKSYIMDNNGNLIGPLSSDHRLVVSTNASWDVGALSKRCKLSTMTLQKLMAYVKNSGTDKITTQELAQRFDITIRNANRILTNLCKGGVATPVYTQTTHSRGRPVQVYELNFD